MVGTAAETEIDPETIEKLKEMYSQLDLSFWFTNRVAISYISSFPIRAQAASGEQELDALQNELDMALTLYSLLVYHTYAKKPEFKKKINSNKELKQNFSLVKNWLDAHEGKRLTEDWIAALKAEIEN